MHTVTLSITNKNVPVRLDVVQYTTAPDIGFVIDDYTPTGRADIYIKKPSGEEIYNHCTIDGNTIIFTPTTQCFAEVGENKAMLQILDGEKLAVSFKIWFIVEENFIDSSAAESQSEFTELQDAISTIGQYDQRIQDVQDAMDTLDTELTEDMSDLQTAVANQLNTAVTTLNNEIDGLDGRLTTAEGNITSITNNGFIYRRQLTSADDLNNITTPGAYYFVTGNVPANSYYENASVIEVFYFGLNNGRLLQRITRYGVAGKSAFRVKTENTWLNWYEYATTDITTSLNTRLTATTTTANNANTKANNVEAGLNNLTQNVSSLDELVRRIIYPVTQKTTTFSNLAGRATVYQSEATLLGVELDGSRGEVSYIMSGNGAYLYDRNNERVIYNLSKEYYGQNRDGAEEVTFAVGPIYIGHITNSSRSIDFFIPTPRNCSGVTIRPVSIETVSVRYAAGGYINGLTDLTTIPDELIVASITAYHGGFRVRLDRAGIDGDRTWKNSNNTTTATNNQPVTVQCKLVTQMIRSS